MTVTLIIVGMIVALAQVGLIVCLVKLKRLRKSQNVRSLHNINYALLVEFWRANKDTVHADKLWGEIQRRREARKC